MKEGGGGGGVLFGFGGGGGRGVSEDRFVRLLGGVTKEVFLRFPFSKWKQQINSLNKTNSNKEEDQGEKTYT